MFSRSANRLVASSSTKTAHEFHRELHSTSPIAVIDRCKLDELITKSVNKFDD